VTPTEIREAVPTDAVAIVRMRRALWPEEPDDHEREAARYFDQRRRDVVILVARVERDAVAGFIEVGARSFAEGCESSPVAYVEGWYVEPHYRRRGVGRELFRAAEIWARERGFVEIGSDALTSNETSIAAHRALGYEEVVRIVCFRRSLA